MILSRSGVAGRRRDSESGSTRPRHHVESWRSYVPGAEGKNAASKEPRWKRNKSISACWIYETHQIIPVHARLTSPRKSRSVAASSAADVDVAMGLCWDFESRWRLHLQRKVSLRIWGTEGCSYAPELMVSRGPGGGNAPREHKG